MEFIQHSGMYKIGDSTRYTWRFLLFWNVAQAKNVSSAIECPVLKGLFSMDVTAKLLLYSSVKTWWHTVTQGKGSEEETCEWNA